MKIRFSIKGPPQKGRKSFCIVRDVVEDTPERKRIKSECYKIKDERIDAINKAYKKTINSKSLEECWDELNKIKNEYYAQEKEKEIPIFYDSKNLKLVDEYMDKKYKRRKCKESSKKSMKFDLIRAVKTLRNTSLYSASEDEIQDLIDANSKNPTQQRRNVMRLRQLLKYIGRSDVVIAMDNEEDKFVKYLTLDELEMLIDCFKSDRVLSCLIEIGGKTGCRQSEIFGLRAHQLKSKKLLYIDSQLLPDKTRCLPKNKKKRMAYILEGASEAIEEWLQISQELKEEYRKGRNRIPLAVRKACKKLFPNNENKWLNFRDLRHIIGVYFAQKGIPTEHIAKSMGNTADVSRKHYQGFMLHDEGIEVIDSLLKRQI